MATGRALIHRYFRELLTAPGNLAVADEIFTADVRFTNPVRVSGVSGIAEYKAFVSTWAVGFPDRNFAVDEIVLDMDETKAAARFTITGTHQGEFLGATPTGHTITVIGMNLFRFREGRIYRVEAFFDPLPLWRPLGVAKRLIEGGS